MNLKLDVLKNKEKQQKCKRNGYFLLEFQFVSELELRLETGQAWRWNIWIQKYVYWILRLRQIPHKQNCVYRIHSSKSIMSEANFQTLEEVKWCLVSTVVQGTWKLTLNLTGSLKKWESPSFMTSSQHTRREKGLAASSQSLKGMDYVHSSSWKGQS